MPFALLVHTSVRVCFMQQYEGLAPRHYFRDRPTGQLTFGSHPRLLHMLFHLLSSLVPPPRDSTHTLFGAVVIGLQAKLSLTLFPSLPSPSRSSARYSVPMYVYLHLNNDIANVACSRTPHIGVAIY
ncbi:hypothetical protein DFH09DRAFT_1300277 [Mycena vulgaris]|nr:hypothetical protein DFH09DRAFT_1300277 [Mycena vulgaris]